MPTNRRYSINHNSSFINFSPGFTFIELLIVITTMSLVFGLGFANFRGYQQRQRIINAARILRSDLRFAQEQALAGIKPAGCGSLNGYQINNNSSTVYEILAKCDSGTYISVKTVNMSDKYSGIQLSFGFILFNVLGRGVDIPRTITMIDTATTPNPTLSIVITKGGQIN